MLIQKYLRSLNKLKYIKFIPEKKGLDQVGILIIF